MRKIYAVIGHTGQYEDNREWIVCAYPNQDSAEGHAQRAKRRADEIFVETGGRFSGYRVAHFGGPVNEFDSEMQMDSSGTSYIVEPVLLHESLRIAPLHTES